MATSKPDILEVIIDMGDFIGMNWVAFKNYMMVKGFSNDEIETMGKNLDKLFLVWKKE